MDGDGNDTRDNHDTTTKAESILNGLLECGNFENIIKNIFKYLNATQLACLQKVFCARSTTPFLDMVDIVFRHVSHGLSSLMVISGVMRGR